MNLGDELRQLKELHSAKLADYLLERRKIFFSSQSSLHADNMDLMSALKEVAKNGISSYNLEYSRDRIEDWTLYRKTFDANNKKYMEPRDFLRKSFFDDLYLFTEFHNLNVENLEL